MAERKKIVTRPEGEEGRGEQGNSSHEVGTAEDNVDDEVPVDDDGDYGDDEEDEYGAEDDDDDDDDEGGLGYKSFDRY